ncbi:MAG: N-acetyltransferase [Proteobacteria bacterium]|nr:MAG: N-acetyltransferase [Pseudomonadota bacterium]
MSLTLPAEDARTLKTERLVLEPIKLAHADGLALALAHPHLYDFIRGEPPTASEMAHRIESWLPCISPKGDELWLNWAARRRDSGELIGHFQGGFRSPTESYVAYTVALTQQRQGFAREALAAIIEFMKTSLGVSLVKAWVDTRNQASIALLSRLGFVVVDRLLKADYFKGADSDEFVFELKL